jgi:hypothetical protein
MGPGTDYKERIKEGQHPVDNDDYVSLVHDMNYDRATNISDIYNADWEAIKSYDNSFHGIIGATGLAIKDILLPPLAQQYFIGNSNDTTDYSSGQQP